MHVCLHVCMYEKNACPFYICISFLPYVDNSICLEVENRPFYDDYRNSVVYRISHCWVVFDSTGDIHHQNEVCDICGVACELRISPILLYWDQLLVSKDLLY